jgi:hypothetical protein
MTLRRTQPRGALKFPALSETSLPSLGGTLPVNPTSEREPQILRVSLLNNPATSIPESDIKQLFLLRRKHREQLEAEEARREIEVFDARAQGKPIPRPPPEIPIPDGLDLDLLRAHEPSSAVRMYAPPVRRGAAEKRAKTVMAKRPDLKQYCPACNPRESDLPHPLPEKRRNGSAHWQVLDEPFLPALPPTSFSRLRKPRAFYLPARNGQKLGIPVILDDLLDIREHEDRLFVRDMTRKAERERAQERKEIADRRKTVRASSKKRQQDVMDLEERSGQLKAQSRISLRHSMMKIRMREQFELTPEEDEAMKELSQYDEQLWTQAQLARKSDMALFMENEA